MTDKEIIKALEHCSNSEAEACHKCPINEECNGDVIYMIRLALDLINRQQQDISTLKTKCYCISNNRDRIKKRLEIVSRDLQEGSSRLTEAEREKFWKTSDDEIREFWLQLYNYTVPENVKQVIPANMLLKLGHITKSTIDFINRQQERLEATIAGQETLQKALAEKDREVAELNSDLKLLRNDYDHLKTNFDETVEKNKRLRDKVVGLTAEKEQLIKTFGECQAEATKALVEKDKEIERLKNELRYLTNECDSITDCINEAVKEARAEAIKECIEKTQAFLAIKCRGVVEDNPNLDEILWGYRREDVDEFLDNLVKER